MVKAPRGETTGFSLNLSFQLYVQFDCKIILKERT